MLVVGDVVNIEQQVGGLGAVSKDKQRDVGASRPEAELVEEGRDTRSARARTHSRGDQRR